MAFVREYRARKNLRSWGLLLFFGCVLFSLCGAQGRKGMELRSRLVEDIDLLIKLDSISSPDTYRELDSAWTACKKEGISDSLLFRWVYRTGQRSVMKGEHALVAGMFDVSVDYFSGLPGKEKYSYLASIKTALGAIYEEMGMWTKAMNFYFDVLEIRELHGTEDSYGNVLNNIGNVYFKQGYYDKAKAYYDSAIVFNTNRGEKRELINNYNNLAGLYYMQGDYKATLSALSQALAQIDREKDPDLYYLVWQNMAVVYNQEGKKLLALDLVREAIAYQNRTHRSLDLVSTYLLVAGIFGSNEPDSSLYYMEMALEKARDLQNHAAEIKALQALYVWNKDEGNFEEACALLERTVWLQDSLRIESIEATHEIEQENQNKDLALQRLEIEKLQNQKQEVILVALLFCLLIALLVVYYRYRLQKRMKKETEELAEQKQVLYEKEKEMMNQREQELRDSLELKNKELTSKVLHLVKNNEFIVDINRELQQLLLELNPKDSAKKEHIREMLVKLRDQGNEGTYAEFKYYFEQVHQSFYENLQKAYPSLTYKDIRLCSFLKLGLSSKEIASITFKEVRSVESARNRLRKKMDLDADVNLIEFFSRF